MLHDVVEDSDVTLDDLRALGISERAIKAIDCLSKCPGEAYEDFIARIHPDELARKVKIENIKGNLDLTRLARFRKKTWCEWRSTTSRYAICLATWTRPGASRVKIQ